MTPAGGSPRTVNYSYETLNRLHTATDEHGTTTYTYTPAGSRASVTQANGVITSYNYDSLNRLTQLASRASNGTVLQQYDYTLDATGRRTRIVEHSGRTSEYRYDDLYRLVEEAITDPQNGNHLAQYQYDMVGNRTQSTVKGVTTSYSYDANDRILSQDGTTYTYDTNGNTLTESSSSGTTTYSWDARNRLIEASTPNGSLLFGYDINGIRTSRSEGGITTNFVVDHNQQYAQVLAEIENGITTKQYTYGDDLLSQTNGAGQERFFLYDGLGTTRALADGAEAVTDTYAYEAFGELMASAGSSDNAYRYTGEQYDSGLDQYYLRARYYDQGVGRFTQTDTWMGRSQDPVTLHKYLYANADPVRHVDPSGNFSIGEAMSAVNNASILVNTAIDGYNRLMSDGDANAIDAIPTLWDYLMSYTIRAIGTSFDSSVIGETSMATAGAVALGGYDEHHTIPVYCCGHKSQTMPKISKADHKVIHAKLYAFVTTVNVSGQSLRLMFQRRAKGSTKAPLQAAASKVIGRTAIVQALTQFYASEGYISKGSPSIGGVLAVEGPRFIKGHHSVRRNCRR